MPRAVRLLFADPRVELLERGSDLWVVSGVDPDRLASLVDDASSVPAVRDSIDDVAEDAVVVHVAMGPDGPASVDAYRSVVSNRNCYSHLTDDGTLILTDQYRNAVSQVPAADRTVAETAVADHLLFRNPVAPTTYLDEIRALEHGAWVHWDLASGERKQARVGTLGGNAEVGADRPAAIGETLESVLDRGADGPSAVTNMLSGGVDSTLAGTYLDDAPAVVMEPDAPELAFECEYANDAVELLDVDARAVPLREADYADQLATSMERLGFPSHYSATAAMDAVFGADDGRRYVNGEGADALFGLTGTKGFRAAARFDDLVPQPMAATLTSLPGSLGEYVSTFALQAERARRPPSHPRSFAQQFAFFTDPAVVADFVGESAVRERARRQYEYVADRVEGLVDDPWEAQLELGHLLSFFAHNTVTQWRQLAYAHGKSLFAPFNTRSVATLSQSIPASERYATDRLLPQRSTTKHLPKRLLDRRLPAYDTDKPKGGGVFPRERFFESGCLEDVFDRYEPPSFVPESMYEDHVESWGPLTWNLVTWAIWRDQVLENDDLAVLDGTTEVVCDGDVQVDRVGDSGTEMRTEVRSS
jgi:hypothetical protein